jgi:hypothetical protein
MAGRVVVSAATPAEAAEAAEAVFTPGGGAFVARLALGP